MKKILIFIIFLSFLSFNNSYSRNKDEFYKKIDLFSEVLEKIQDEYVDEINQAEIMDSAINGVLQSLDPYSAYMSPELFNDMQTDTRGKFGGLGIEVGQEDGYIKVISPIDDTPAAKAGIKSGDYIVKIGKEQVQGKSLLEAVKLARKVIKTKPLSDIIVKEFLPGDSISSDEDLINYCKKMVKTNWHPVGTCKMGNENDEMAVLNTKLQVLGVKNLRVFDVSMMPNIVSANTNAPAMAIADKATELLLGI